MNYPEAHNLLDQRMKKTYALKKLLEHGELKFREMREITGWTEKSTWSALNALQISGIVKSSGKLMKRVYFLDY